MAPVVTDVQERVDFLLDYLLQAWRELPEVEQNIDYWDLIEQIDYVEEWTPKMALMDELERYASDGVLTDQQQERYRELLGLARKHRATLEGLRRS
ncbi:MAG: hypothetical protein J7M34_01950 [Anaerolineae bacterium]|nr:hypothetical protein [Anaerolineae bacterium]